MKFTYLFNRKSDGLTKIGRSASPADRIKTLGGVSRMSVIAVIPNDCEAELHRKHANYRVSGEWFRLPADVLEDYKQKHPVHELPGKDFLAKRDPIDPSAPYMFLVPWSKLDRATKEALLAHSIKSGKSLAALVKDILIAQAAKNAGFVSSPPASETPSEGGDK